MAQGNGNSTNNSKIIPLGQTEGPYGNQPYYQGRTPKQGTKPLKP